MIFQRELDRVSVVRAMADSEQRSLSAVGKKDGERMSTLSRCYTVPYSHLFQRRWCSAGRRFIPSINLVCFEIEDEQERVQVIIGAIVECDTIECVLLEVQISLRANRLVRLALCRPRE